MKEEKVVQSPAHPGCVASNKAEKIVAAPEKIPLLEKKEVVARKHVHDSAADGDGDAPTISASSESGSEQEQGKEELDKTPQATAKDNQEKHTVHLACVVVMSLGFGGLLFWSEGGLAAHFQATGRTVNWRGTW